MKKTIFILIVFIILGILPKSVFAIGMMTKPIIIDNALRGEIIQGTLNLYGSQEDTIYGLIAEGEIRDWASFYSINDLDNPITEIKMPASFKVDAIVKFNIPKDVPNGTYTGTVAVLEYPEKNEGKEGMNVSVGLRVDREVLITVTDKEIIDFTSAIIPKKYDVSQGESLKIKVIFDNQGNVSIKPDIQLKILKDNIVVHNAIYMYPETEEPVRSRQRKIIENFIEWPTTGQEKGYYVAETTILLNNEEKDKQDFRFTIGYGTSGFMAAINWLGRGNLLAGWFVFGLIFVVLAGVLTLFYKKPQLLKTAIRRIKSLF